MRIDITVGEHLVIVELQREFIDEFLLQIRVAYGNIERISILVQRLYLGDGWLLRAALVQEFQVRLLAYLPVECSFRKQVYIVVSFAGIAIEQVGLQVAGIGYVAAEVEVNLFVDKLEVEAYGVRYNVILVV